MIICSGMKPERLGERSTPVKRAKKLCLHRETLSMLESPGLKVVGATTIACGDTIIGSECNACTRTGCTACNC